MTGDDPLAYCYRVLVPTWERWTDGNPSVRRVLDCASADPKTHQERSDALMAVILQLLARPGKVGVAGAVLAAMAVHATLEDGAGGGYGRLCRFAVDADRGAMARLPRA